MSSLNDGLLLHLPLNEILNGNQVFDSSDNRLNGTVHNANVVDDPDFGRCLEFAGTNDSYVELAPLQETVDFSQGFTVEAWVKCSQGNGQYRILELGDQAGQGYTLIFKLYFNAGSNRFNLALEFYAGTNQIYTIRETSDTIEVDRWVHVAASIGPDIAAELLSPGGSLSPQEKEDRQDKIKHFFEFLDEKFQLNINGIYCGKTLDSSQTFDNGYYYRLREFAIEVKEWARYNQPWPTYACPMLLPFLLPAIKRDRNLIGKSGLSENAALKGRLAQLRVYTRSLLWYELQWDRQEDYPAKHQFRTAYPIDFRVENADAQSVLLLDNNPNGQDMTLSISNRARVPIQVVAKSGSASPTNFHFALQFRPGTLAQINQIALRDSDSQDGWSLTAQVGQAGQGDCLYLLRTKPLAIAVGFEVTLMFQHMMADGAAGTRGTRVLLRYNQLQMAAGEPIIGTREQYLDVVYAHGSQPKIPFSYNSDTQEITVQGSLKSPQDGQPLQVASSLKVSKNLTVDQNAVINQLTLNSGSLTSALLPTTRLAVRGGVSIFSQDGRYGPPQDPGDGNLIAGNMFLGDFDQGRSGLAHTTSRTPDGYALAQTVGGHVTLINKKSGPGFIGFCIGDQPQVMIDDRGFMGIGTYPYPSTIPARLSVGGGVSIFSQDGRSGPPQDPGDGNLIAGNMFLGRLGLGPFGDISGLAHMTSRTTDGYALAQTVGGHVTLINKNSGPGFIGFCINNQPQVVVDDRGFMGIGRELGDIPARLSVRGGVLISSPIDNRSQVVIDDRGFMGIGRELGDIPARLSVRGGVLISRDRFGFPQNPRDGNPLLVVEGGIVSQGGTKQFVIDHPTQPNYNLVHACVEGPEAGVYYRGNAQLVDGKAVIKLPDYFEALTRKAGRTVLLTAKGREPFLLSYEDVEDGKFNVYGTKKNGEFDWEVKAVRSDVEELEVEVNCDRQSPNT